MKFIKDFKTFESGAICYTRTNRLIKTPEDVKKFLKEFEEEKKHG